MINKTILVGLVAIAFVAGTVMTGTLVYGAKAADPIVTALNSFASQSASPMNSLHFTH